MRKEGEEKERKGERLWEKPIAGARHKTTSPHNKTPNHRHRTQANLLRGQTLPRNQPKSRRPILATSRKLIIQ
jgi:hypothetical protein